MGPPEGPGLKPNRFPEFSIEEIRQGKFANGLPSADAVLKMDRRLEQSARFHRIIQRHRIRIALAPLVHSVGHFVADVPQIIHRNKQQQGPEPKHNFGL